MVGICGSKYRYWLVYVVQILDIGWYTWFKVYILVVLCGSKYRYWLVYVVLSIDIGWFMWFKV